MKNKKNISTDDIQNLLKEIKYPGFKRDIVSFGFVKNIVVEGTSIEITLQINSDNEKTISQLRQDINKKFNDNGLTKIIINIHKPVQQSPH